MIEATIAAEQAVLGALLDGAELSASLRPEHFSEAPHADLYAELVRRNEAGAPCNAIAMRDWWVADAGRASLDEGEPYLSFLVYGAPSHESLGAYAEQVKAFELLGTEWTAESEELTPTLKLKRRVVNTKYSDVLDRLYG